MSVNESSLELGEQQNEEDFPLISILEYVKDLKDTKVEENIEQNTQAEISTPVSTTPIVYEASYFKKMGVLNWGGWKWTYYSERVLPGGGLKIPGRHADENGFICDENNYICLASSTLSKGTVVDTPFGKKGYIYDCGCAADVIDTFVNW